MEDNKEKYIYAIKSLYSAFKPQNTSLLAKIVLAILALIVCLLIALLRNLIF